VTYLAVVLKASALKAKKSNLFTATTSKREKSLL